MEHQSDHDLLIRVDENVKNLITETKSMRDSAQEKILDHETRLRVLEFASTAVVTKIKTWGAIAVLGLGILETLLHFFVK